MTMKRRFFPAVVLALTTLTIAAGPAPMVWNVDVPHTGIGFSVKHFFTPVRGEFTDYDVNLVFDKENPENSSVSVTIDVASIDTGNERRDAHLMSGDFFNAEMYPHITFESREVVAVADGQLVVRGPLTIRDQTRDIDLPVTILGVRDIPQDMQEMLGGITELAAFEAGLEIDRNEYGVGTGSWAATLVVGGEVDIDIAVEANRK
jgi:polyisoprenoid-binding protein YceI